MSNPTLIVLAVTGVIALLLAAVWRPALAVTLLAVAIPISAGIPRGQYLPLLRVNEALLLVVAAGFVVHELTRRRDLPFNSLDLAVFSFCAAGTLIPSGLIVLTRQPADQSDWMTVVGPMQYLLVFAIYSRTAFTASGLRLFLNGMMLASVPVAGIAVAELLNVGGVRELVATYYPTQPLPSWDTVYRPASLLGHYSAVGAFGLLNFLLALALAATRHRGFPAWWLALVMGANLVGAVASNTYAPLLALPLGTVMVLVIARRVPWRELLIAPPALIACGVLLWPAVQRRIDVQLAGNGGQFGIPIPESLQTRIDYWQGFFVPALSKHGLWWGTGTLMPSEVPGRLTLFVDNGYLWEMFRAGLPGLATYLILLGAIASAAWATRSLQDASRRAVGAVCLGAVACVVVLDGTSEYLTFTAVTQEFWMLVGLLSGLALAARPAPVRFVALRPQLAPVIPAWWTGVSASVRRLTPDTVLVRSSLAVLAGFGLAKVFGFLFQVASGRVLAPAEYGRLTYALAVASVVSVLLTTAPLGLSRFLARHEGNRREQTAYYSSWLMVVGLVLVLSMAVTVAVATPAGLGGWMLAGLLANLLGVAALETYRELQRGLGRYALQSIFYVLANVLQLVIVLVVAGLGWRSPALFLMIYGLSGVAALLIVAPVGGVGLSLSGAGLQWRRVIGIAGFIRPVLLQAVFWNLWFSGDLILVQRLLSPTATGNYGAAKAIANGFALIPTAISFVFAPRVARLAEVAIRGHLVRAMGLAAVLTLPLALAMVVFAGPLTAAVFGGRYHAAAVPLVVLTVGMALYGLKSILGGLWLGLGYPVVETVASAAAMLTTLVAGLIVIPTWGLVGAAAAFSAGSAAQLLVAGAVTMWALSPRTPRVRQLSDRRILGGEAPAQQQAALAVAASEPAILLVAEELDLVQDEGYTKFTRTLEAELGRRRPLVVHITRANRGDRRKLIRMLHRTLEVGRAGRRPELRHRPPRVVVYASRSSITLAALLRARLLRRRCRAPVAIVGLQTTPGKLRGRLARRLAPDLLLLSTENECQAARRLGLNAHCIWSGVDLDRFRPARPGEKTALREKWGLPPDRRIALHVGHLKEGRNLQALIPLAAVDDITVLMVASGRRSAESEGLAAELVAHKVMVLSDYQPEVEELYRLADCYVFPTTAQDSAVAMPLSVLEALASDLPVVSMRFGALAERLGAAPGMELVDSPDQLVERTLALAGQPVQTRALAEPFSWSAIVDRLLGLLDELSEQDEASRARGRAGRRPSVVAVAAAKARRSVAARRGFMRRLVWRRAGYQVRLAESAVIERLAFPRHLPSPASPASDVVGLAKPAPASSAVKAAATHYGLSIETADVRGAVHLMDQALVAHWPLLWGDGETLAGLVEHRSDSLAAFVNRGGTVYVDDLHIESNQMLAGLSLCLGGQVPSVREVLPAEHVVFPEAQAEFAHELAGTRVRTSGGKFALDVHGNSDVLALGLANEDPAPVVVRQRFGRGQVVLSTLEGTLKGTLADAFGADQPSLGRALVPMMLLREVYGRAAWHPPAVLANFSIDDPALQEGRLGARYQLLLGLAREHRFHVTVATVPRDLRLAERSVVWLLRRHPDLLSACYHGCDHDGYEFYLPEGRRTRHRPRPLQEQRRALARAVEYGRRFQARHEYELDRIMVFPYGVGPAELFTDLRRLGFLATCNYGDKYPLGAVVPEDVDLGMRPADLAWRGFPLLWRRGLSGEGYLLDLFCGRPVLMFAHLPALGSDLGAFVERADLINRAAGGAAVWRGLEEVARHAYLQRRDPKAGWEVLMTTDEACLHNPDLLSRTYTIKRPHRPPQTFFEVDGSHWGELESPTVTVPPNGTVTVRLVAADSGARLPARRSCSILPGPEMRPVRGRTELVPRHSRRPGDTAEGVHPVRRPAAGANPQ